MVISAAREQINRVSRKVAWIFEVVGLTPNALTLIGLAITTVGSTIIARGGLFLGALVATIGSILDTFDGALARRTGRVSAFGGYLDSLVDRYADAVVFFAVGWYYQQAWIWGAVFAALVGAMATSYARARTYQDVSPEPDQWPDLVERPERLIILLAGIGFQGISDALGNEVAFLPWIVVALAVLGHVTVIQRARRAKRFIEEAEHG